MSGNFNLTFYHGVPAVDSWQALFKRRNIVRMLPQNEMNEAIKVMQGDMDERYNVTIRWHESHYDGCPYKCASVAQIAVPKATPQPSSKKCVEIHKPCSPRSAQMKKIPDTSSLQSIVRPPARPPLPSAPSPVAKSDAAMEQNYHSNSSSSACAEPNQKAVETHQRTNDFGIRHAA